MIPNGELTYYQFGSNRVFLNANNGKREVWINLAGPNGTYTVTLSGRTVSNGRFVATINFSEFWKDFSNSAYYLRSFLIWNSVTQGGKYREPSRSSVGVYSSGRGGQNDLG